MMTKFSFAVSKSLLSLIPATHSSPLTQLALGLADGKWLLPPGLFQAADQAFPWFCSL
jgi:hypothetical protein